MVIAPPSRIASDSRKSKPVKIRSQPSNSNSAIAMVGNDQLPSVVVHGNEKEPAAMNLYNEATGKASRYKS
jgi:hypothetical protein